MRKLALDIRELLSSLDQDSRSVVAAALVHARFADAVRKEYGDEGAAFVLSHVQAVYVQRDDEAPGRGPDARPGVVMRVYADDSLVRSDLDARQESLKIKLMPMGVRFDRLKVHASSFGMRKREPFADIIAQMQGERSAAQFDAAQHMSTQEIEDVLSRVDDPTLRSAIGRAIKAYNS